MGPRPEAVLADDDLRRISARVMFCSGTSDPYVAPAQARPWAAKIPSAVFREVPGGHGPWLGDPRGCAALVTGHLTEAGFPPAAASLTAHPPPCHRRARTS